ncbi:hypothetical protein C2E20_9088 isoform A [Micractinium conductrix]|uniref:Uncharacterized protein n=1 Tax=Micractinium conductrix TaxID=554055 RepID=A0A2P6UZJ3_9CHLO|nr:hypothetical protein C2E20_9088 isoform A [Micractinium conductrix]|eukprot:PSC67224.1 hypothetical protein C2E20_9088 isoform A [Micractinium conductrix]
MASQTENRVGLTQRLTNLISWTWGTATASVASVERLLAALAGAGIGGVEGAYQYSKALLSGAEPLPGARSRPMLRGRSASDGGGGDAGRNADLEPQVIGLGAGYSLNVASAEAAPEAPSPQQYTPPRGPKAAPAEEELGIGAGVPRAPATPAAAAALPSAIYSQERPEQREAPHAFGEGYAGQEEEAMGTQLQGPEEPRPAGPVTAPGLVGEGVEEAPPRHGRDHLDALAREGGPAVGPASPQRARLDALARETWDIRAKTSEALRRAEEMPGGEEEGEEARPPALAHLHAPTLSRKSPAGMEPMPPAMISGDEGRPLAPGLEALPEGVEEGGSVEGSAHAARPLAAPAIPPGLELAGGVAAGGAAAAAAPSRAAPAAEGGAAARLKGLFAEPEPAQAGGAAAVGEAAAAEAAKRRVTAERIPFAVWGAVPAEGPMGEEVAQLSAQAGERQKARILGGAAGEGAGGLEAAGGVEGSVEWEGGAEEREAAAAEPLPAEAAAPRALAPGAVPLMDRESEAPAVMPVGEEVEAAAPVPLAEVERGEAAALLAAAPVGEAEGGALPLPAEPAAAGLELSGAEVEAEAGRERRTAPAAAAAGSDLAAAEIEAVEARPAAAAAPAAEEVGAGVGAGVGTQGEAALAGAAPAGAAEAGPAGKAGLAEEEGVDAGRIAVAGGGGGEAVAAAAPPTPLAYAPYAPATPGRAAAPVPGAEAGAAAPAKKKKKGRGPLHKLAKMMKAPFSPPKGTA